MIFGTWTWCNLGFAGSWQLALGLALLGEIAALYFILVDFRPLAAGAFFAPGDWKPDRDRGLPSDLHLFVVPANRPRRERLEKDREQVRQKPCARSSYFLIVPGLLGVLTAIYNYARFDSPFDFGYARIPRLLQEPWYQHGLFSLHAIPWNAYKMLGEGFGDLPDFPFIHPYAFGCSIFLASPFFFLLFREGGPHKIAAWIAIGLLTDLVDAWQSGRVAIFVSLRDGDVALDVSVVARQRSGEDFR